MAYSPPYDLIVSSLYHILHKITVDFAKIPVKSSPFLSSSFFYSSFSFFLKYFVRFWRLFCKKEKPSVIEKENEDEITRQSALVCVWWSLDGSWLVAGWTAVVHHHRRHPRRDAVLQAGRTGIFPVWQGHRLRRRCALVADEPAVAAVRRICPCHFRCAARAAVLHHHRRYPLWDAVL